MITLSALVSLVVWLIIAGLVYWLVLWVLGQIGVPEPFNKVIRVVVAIFVFLIVLNALLTLAGVPIVKLG